MRRLIGVLAALALLLGVTGCTPTDALGGKRTVVADLTSASGLFVGNDVGILGVTVGTVTDIEPRGETVRVTMEVDEDQALPEGVGAVVVSRSAATDRYVELTPAYSSGPKAAGDVSIPLEQTRVPVEFDEVLGTLGDFSDGISGEGETRNAIKRLLSSSAKAFDGRGDLLNSTLTSLAAAVSGVAAERGNAADTLEALDELTQGLAANEATVREFVRQVAEASDLLAAERKNFRSSIRQTTRMIRVVADFVRDNRAELRKTVNRSNGVMRTVLDRRDQVAEILSVTPLAAQNLMRMLTPEDRLLVRLDPAFLTPLAGIVGPLCESLPGDPCTAIGLDPDGLINLINELTGGLLGGLGGRE